MDSLNYNWLLWHTCGYKPKKPTLLTHGNHKTCINNRKGTSLPFYESFMTSGSLLFKTISASDELVNLCTQSQELYCHLLGILLFKATTVNWPGSYQCPDPPEGTADGSMPCPSLLHASAVCTVLPEKKMSKINSVHPLVMCMQWPLSNRTPWWSGQFWAHHIPVFPTDITIIVHNNNNNKCTINCKYIV